MAGNILQNRSANRARFPDDPAFKALRVGDIEGYHRAIQGREVIDFRGADLRGCDMRNVDLSRVLLRDAYLREADLRGCDLRKHDLEGCSIYNAKISGAFFPDNIPAEEIRLSLEYGTRLRTRKERSPSGG